MKTVKEIELAVKNEPGQLSVVSELLGANGIQIIAFYLSKEGADKGRLRFVANDPERAINVLKTTGEEIKTGDVIACEIPGHPGGFNAVLKPLKQADINLDYVYPCMGRGEETILILGLEPLEEAQKALEENWIRVLGEEIYDM